MNITHEKNQDLTALIKIELLFTDYEDALGKSLSEIRKTAQIKGFRPGKVPMGLVKKMYGMQAAAEEANKVLSEGLTNYIKEQEFNMIGQPINNFEKTPHADLLNDEKAEFFFDIGLIPEFEINLSKEMKFDRYVITSDDERMNQHIEDLKKRFGNNIDVDEVGKSDVVFGNVVELDENSNYKDNGINHDTSISIEFIKDEKSQKDFLGKKPGDTIVFNPLKSTGNKTETASMLNIEKDKIGDTTSDFEFTIDRISRLEPASLNKELYKKVFPEENITNKDQFKERIWKDASIHYQVEADGYFSHIVIDKLLKDINMNLPDAFIKRWMLTQDEKMTEEIIEHQYKQYAHSFRNEILINKIVADYKIKVEEKDIRDHITDQYSKMFMSADNDAMKDQLKMIVDNVMQNQEEVNKIYNQLLTEQLAELFKSELTLEEKEMSYSEFSEIVKNHHHHEH